MAHIPVQSVSPYWCIVAEPFRYVLQLIYVTVTKVLPYSTFNAGPVPSNSSILDSRIHTCGMGHADAAWSI